MFQSVLYYEYCISSLLKYSTSLYDCDFRALILFIYGCYKRKFLAGLNNASLLQYKVKVLVKVWLSRMAPWLGI